MHTEVGNCRLLCVLFPRIDHVPLRVELSFDFAPHRSVPDR